MRSQLLTPILSLSLLCSSVATATGIVSLTPAPVQAQTKAVKSVWSAHNVDDGGFNILLPGIVDRRVNSPKILGNSTEQTLLLASQDRHDAFYMVAWSDLSINANLSDDAQTRVLNLAKDSFLRSFKGTLSEHNDLRLSGNPGKQFSMVSQVRGKPFMIRSRSYLVGSRLYHVLAAVPQGLDRNLIGSTNGFLKSFQLQPGFHSTNLAQRPAEDVSQPGGGNAAELMPAVQAPVERPAVGQPVLGRPANRQSALPAPELLPPLVQDPAAQRLF